MDCREDIPLPPGQAVSVRLQILNANVIGVNDTHAWIAAAVDSVARGPLLHHLHAMQHSITESEMAQHGGHLAHKVCFKARAILDDCAATLVKDWSELFKDLPMDMVLSVVNLTVRQTLHYAAGYHRRVVQVVGQRMA